MRYDASLGRYRHSANIALSQGMVTALAAANGTLTVYTGGTGYDKTKESFTVIARLSMAVRLTPTSIRTSLQLASPSLMVVLAPIRL